MATMHRLLPPPLHTNQSTYSQSALGPLASHARLEVVEERGEDGNDAGDTLRKRVELPQPEHSTNVPGSKPTSHDRSDIGDRNGDATGAESGGSTFPKRLDAVRLDGSEDHTTARTISKKKFKLKPVIPPVPNSPPSGLLSPAMILAIY
jgi:hypothetical protein